MSNSVISNLSFLQNRLTLTTTKIIALIAALLFLILAVSLSHTIEVGELADQLEVFFSGFVHLLEKTIFFEINGIPLIVAWLLMGGIFFTLRMGFINIRGLKHALDVVRGKYDEEEEEGSVSHFQALTTALSGTVGIGNIAGIAIAINMGGPGAVLWIALTGVLGMSIKFVECTLGQKYRQIKPDGTIAGGPMYYLDIGLDKLGLAKLGKFLAVIYAFFCMTSTLGGSSMFQANQSCAGLVSVMPFLADFTWLYGVLLALLVGVVIIGGIERIGSVAEKIVPLMAGVYLAACIWVLTANFSLIPTALHTIVDQAFQPEAAYGGALGVFIIGFRRSVFSNEAGVGSAAIVHSTAKTKEPIREGIVASLEPLIDTVIICNMTALVIVITGVYQDGLLNGSQLTSASFATVIGWFPYVVAIAGFLFAFSTMISWSYYGERAWEYLWGSKTLIIYKLIFLACVLIGSVINLEVVLEFSDMMLLAMTVPNLLGCYLMSSQVAGDLRSYMERLRS